MKLQNNEVEKHVSKCKNDLYWISGVEEDTSNINIIFFPVKESKC